MLKPATRPPGSCPRCVDVAGSYLVPSRVPGVQVAGPCLQWLPLVAITRAFNCRNTIPNWAVARLNVGQSVV